MICHFVLCTALTNIQHRVKCHKFILDSLSIYLLCLPPLIVLKIHCINIRLLHVSYHHSLVSVLELHHKSSNPRHISRHCSHLISYPRSSVVRALHWHGLSSCLMTYAVLLKDVNTNEKIINKII